MASRFLLRSEEDSDNPMLPRFYGDGVTLGRVVFYKQSAIGNRTGFVALIAQGARFPGDTGCGQIKRVLYAGFDLPEFDGNGQRNWKYHKGIHTPHPIYKPFTALASTDTFTSTAHGYANDDPLAFHARGLTAKLPTPIPPHTKYFAKNITPNTFQVAATVGGAVIPLNADSITGAGIFVYKANVGLFDPEQGRPFFFPTLDFTFTAKSYIEILLPAELSNGEDEPTRLKLIPRGKQIYDFVIDVDGYLSPTGVPLDSENNALVAHDLLRYDGQRPRTRLNAPSFVAWRNKADQTIPWVGGNDAASQPVYLTVIGASVDTTANKVTRTAAGSDFSNSGVFTQQFSTTEGSVELRYNGGNVALHFTSTPVVSDNTKQGVVLFNGELFVNTNGEWRVARTIANSDRVKIRYANGNFFVFVNSVNMVLPPGASGTQLYPQFYADIELYAPGTFVDQVFVQPSGTNTIPRQVKRYTGDLAAVHKTAVIDGFEHEMNLSPGCSWQDVDGEITILTEAVRVPVMTLRFDPTQTAIPSNTSRCKIKRRGLDDSPNYWRYQFRNKDDAILEKAYVFTDRPNRRKPPPEGVGRLIDAGGLIQSGVMTQSLQERLGETRARLISDLDVGWEVDAFLDSIKLAKGDFVWIVDPVGGHTEANPAKAMVLKETFRLPVDDVEERSFELNIITDDWYSDTTQGALVVPGILPVGNAYIPPPVAEILNLSETGKRLADGTYVPTIEGEVVFAPTPNQFGRVYVKSLAGSGVALTLNHTTDTFTHPAGNSFPGGDRITLAPTSLGGALPAELSIEHGYYPVNQTSTTFQVSLEEGGDPITFASNGTGTIKAYPYANWVLQNFTVRPDPATRAATFEVQNVIKGFHFVRVAAYSSGSITGIFTQQRTSNIDAFGDTVVPEPPAWARYIYDGVAITFYYPASPSPNVRGYIALDSSDNVIFQGDALSFAIPARSASFTVRVFAYSFSSVVSTQSASVQFVLPPTVSWANVLGHTILPDGSLQKTATTAWGNAGATANRAFLSGTARFSIVTTSVNAFKAFGLASKQAIDSFDDIDFCVYLRNDGIAEIRELGSTVYFVGPYTNKQRFSVTVDANGVVKYWVGPKQTANDEGGLLWTSAVNANKYPLYPAVSMYTQDDVFSGQLELEGNLMEQGGISPHLQNVVAATYDESTGTLAGTNTTANSWGTAGASSVEKLTANQDGGFRFKFSQTNKYVVVGLNTADINQEINSIPFGIYCHNDGNVYARQNAAETFIVATTTSDAWFVGRENGKMIIRKNGVKVFPTVGTIVLAGALLLDAAFYAGGAVNSLKMLKSENQAQTGSGATAPLITKIGPSALLGKTEAEFVSLASASAVTPESDFRSSDTATPVISGAVKASVAFVKPYLDGTDDVEVQLFLTTPTKKFDNFGSVARARVRVLNKFGQSLVVFEPMAVCKGGCLLPKFTHTRKYADPLEEAIYGISFENAYGWSGEIFLNKQVVTTTLPPAINQRDCPLELMGTEGQYNDLRAVTWKLSINNQGLQTLRYRLLGKTDWIIWSDDIDATDQERQIDVVLIAPGRWYEVQVKNNNTGGWSNILLFFAEKPTVPNTNKPAIMSLRAFVVSTTSVKLVFARVDTTNTAIAVYRDGVLLTDSLAANAVEYTDTTAAAGVTYLYTVFGIYSGSPGQQSASVLVSVPFIPAADDPTNLRYQVISPERVDFQWDLNGNTGGVVFEYKELLPTPGSWVTETLDWDIVFWTFVASPGKRYAFRVKAGTSNYTNTVVVDVPPVPAVDLKDPR